MEAARGSSAWTLSRRHAEAAAWVLVLLALGLRLRGLGEWWVNPDEGSHLVIAAADSWREFFWELGWNAHPPLYFAILRWAAGFTTDLALLRLVSVLAGALAVHGVYRMGREWIGPVAGLVGAALIAVSPGAVLQSQLLRPYALQLLCLAYALSLLPAALERADRRALYGYGCAMGLAVLTHYSSLLLLPVTGGLLIHAWWRRVVTFRQLLAAHLPLLLAGAIVAPHLLALSGSQMQDAARATWLRPYLPDSAAEAWNAWLGLHAYWYREWLGLSWLAFCAGAALLAWDRRGRLLALSLGAGVVALAVALLDQYPFGATRHDLFLLLPSLLPMSYLAARSLGERRVGAAVAVVVLLGLGFPGLFDRVLGVGADQFPPQGERVLRAEAFRDFDPLLERIQQEGTPVVFDMQTYFMLFPRLPEHRNPGTDGEGPALARFRWGRSDVVVSRSLILSTLPGVPAFGLPLADFLRQVDGAFPELELLGGPVWLVFAGWGAGDYARIRELEHGTWGPPFLRGRITLRDAIGALRLEPLPYLRAVKARTRTPRKRPSPRK